MSGRCKGNKSQKKITKSEFFQDDDNNAKLIRFVYERPALYNYKLPVKERSHIYKNELWEEVAFSLGGKTFFFLIFIYFKINLLIIYLYN